MDYAHVGGSDPNARFYHDNNNNNINNSNNNNNNPHGNIISQVEAQAQYDSKEQQTLRSRMERRQYELQKRQQQQQQQEPQHIVQDIQWGQIETPLSTYPTSDPRSSFSPEHTFSPESQTYYVPDSNINAGYTDVQNLMHSAFYGVPDGFNAVNDTPRYEEQHGWTMVPNSGIGIDVGLPVTSGPAGFSLDPSLSAHLDSNRFFEDLNFNGELLQGFPSDQPIDFLSPPSRGVALFDSPVPDYEFPQGQAPVDLWSPQERLLVSPQDIETWFCENYASKRSDLPTNHMSEQNGGIWCRLCSPEYTYWAPDMYRQHKEETHGIDFKTGLIYWAPMEIRAIEGGVGLGYEGYCATCLKRIPLDMTKPDFNWFYHASKCQDITVPTHTLKPGKEKLIKERPSKQKASEQRSKDLPANPLERWQSSGSEDEGCSLEDIDKEAKKRLAAGEYLLPKPPFASNSNSNPSDGNSDVWSSASSRSVLTSNSGSGSSCNSAMSQHSLESRRKKVLRMRKRKGARSSNQGLRVYQCTFCMADFANYGDWRRHEEVIHLVLDKWVCAPEGQYKGNTRECVYCDEVHEEQSNIPNRCNASYCHGKGPAERVFARKDHLKQHLKRMHGITTWRPSFECWSKKAKGPQKSRCGFCTTTFDDWHTRMQHVALEFKNGQKMASWEGDWGLDATWMMGKLGNAMLPISRPDHISNTIQNDIGENPQLQTPRNTPQTAGGGGVVSGGSASAIPDKGKGRLRRKPGLNSLGSGFAAKLPEEYWQDIHQPQGDVSQQMVEQFYLQQQQNQQQQFQGHVLTPTESWSTTPPSQQSPLTPYSTNNPYPNNPNPPVNIQPRPPENQGSAAGVNGSRVVSGGGKLIPKPHQCPICATPFSRQDNLRRHIKTHFVKER